MVTRIAILGGTFDPIHIGHLAIAEDIRFALGAERILFVPAAQQPLKAYRHTATAEDRLAMVRLAIVDNTAFAASDIEVARGGLSYTIDTVGTLQQQYPHAELFFAVGADAAIDLPRWHKIDELLQLCRIAIVQRPGYTLNFPQLVDQLQADSERLTLIAGPALDISASELRERLRTDQPVRYHLPAAVREYIERHGLYRDMHQYAATRAFS